MTGKELRIAFVGSVIPEAECVVNPVCNAAGNKFQRKFIGALRHATGRMVDVISFIPAAMFPTGRQIVFRSGTLEIETGVPPAEYIAFLNLPVLKQFTQAVSILVKLARWHWRFRKSRRVVISYNVFAAHALPVLTARRLFGGRAVALIADLPHGIYDFAGLWGLLQRLDMMVQTRSISGFDGQITLTAMIASDFAPAVPAILMEGGVDCSEADQTDAVPEGDGLVRILFSGTLNEINGTRLMLDAFALIKDRRYRLRIFGRGPLEDLVASAAKIDPRIEYLGFQGNAEIVRQQRQATLLLNPRPTAHAITRYTFPSKLLEYMLSGRPVVTTRLAGISADYYPHLYLLTEETPAGLADLLLDVCNRPATDLEALGAAARDFVLQNKTWDRQGERVVDFVTQLAGVDRHS